MFKKTTNAFANAVADENFQTQNETKCLTKNTIFFYLVWH